jgi:hypothetical protein
MQCSFVIVMKFYSSQMGNEHNWFHPTAAHVNGITTDLINFHHLLCHNNTPSSLCGYILNSLTCPKQIYLWFQLAIAKLATLIRPVSMGVSWVFHAH